MDEDLSSYVLVMTTVDTKDGADKLSRSVVDARLAASGQVSGPIETTYRHLGEVAQGTEWQVLFRTTGDRLPELAALVGAEHPYDSPEIISLPILSGPPAYLEWITRATR
ncbi:MULTISPECIES: divalent-cation tolerance protein CutA [unclassified Streptomyces]|uniref:Divalent-cation tolerance protein CutA n=1 Tax=Streptomyces sp. NBC_00060 TaxID=2975636 RepID=A0AAU2HCS1_9ACTN